MWCRKLRAGVASTSAMTGSLRCICPQAHQHCSDAVCGKVWERWMSKFFDKVKGGANPAATPAGNRPFDLERELAAMTQRMDGQVPAVILDGANAAQLDADFGIENAVASEIAQFRLANCRKIELPKNSDKLVLSGTSPAIESYKSLRTRLTRAQANRGIHSIVVASAAQGDGKT